MKPRPPQSPLPALGITCGILLAAGVPGLCCSEMYSGETSRHMQAYFVAAEPQMPRSIETSRIAAQPPVMVLGTEAIVNPELLLPEEWDTTTDEELAQHEPELPLLLTAEITPPSTPQQNLPTTTSPTHKAAPAVCTAPTLLHGPAPAYPPALRASRRSGSVQVRIHIDTSGCPTAVDILSASHPAFAQAARQCILKSWRFSPARRGNAAISSTAVQTVNFRI